MGQVWNVLTALLECSSGIFSPLRCVTRVIVNVRESQGFSGAGGGALSETGASEETLRFVLRFETAPEENRIF